MNLDEDTNISKEEFFKACESETLLGSVCHYLDRCLDWQSLSLFFYRIERQTHVVSVVSLFILQLSTIHSVFFLFLNLPRPGRPWLRWVWKEKRWRICSGGRG